MGIAPNGHISFLSAAWGGRASDQMITRKSGFYTLLKRNDLILADRGFLIREDLMTYYCHLEIPPSSSGLHQMSEGDVMKTKDVANARIHVERAIGRMKRYSILTNKLPITLVPLIDDITIICAALCNLFQVLWFKRAHIKQNVNNKTVRFNYSKYTQAKAIKVYFLCM